MVREWIKGLEPHQVWEQFDALTQIPRGSCNEKAVSDYIRDFALNLGLETYQDEVYNLIIRKPATPGYENAPITVLQAHLDMVCVKTAGSNHDFTKDPIDVYLDGEWVRAKDTTLGADNGTGLAFAMCVLASNDIPHPPLEVVLTANEEAGMTGIRNLDFSKIHGRVIVNLDCSDAGIVLGCAGTATAQFTVPFRREMAAGYVQRTVQVTGLQGGHSGLHITLERGNANVIATQFLSRVQEAMDLRLISWTGGTQGNAITPDATVVVAVPEDQAARMQQMAEDFQALLKKEYRVTDSAVTLTVTPARTDVLPVCAEDTDRFVSVMALAPTGVLKMFKEVENLPETSGNIGIVSTDDEAGHISILYRSCFDHKKQWAIAQCRRLARVLNVPFTVEGDSPEWEYRSDSKLSRLIQDVYFRRYGEQLLVEVSHGGNECGSFFRQFPDSDIVCTGTHILNAHSPSETVKVSVVQKEWEMLLLTLAELKHYDEVKA